MAQAGDGTERFRDRETGRRPTEQLEGESAATLPGVPLKRGGAYGHRGRGDGPMSSERRWFHELDGDPETAFLDILRQCDRMIDDLLSLRSAPEETKLGDIVVHRFPERDLRNAVLLKLTMLASNFRAGKLLIDHGFMYEWNMVFRAIEETVEDVLFLLGKGLAKDRGDLHGRYLEAFHAEDIDERGRPIEKGVHAPRRAEIRSFLDAAEKETLGEDDSAHSLAGTMKFLHRLGSGHVHGRAASIMKLYCTGSRSFRTDGLDGSDRRRNELDRLWQMFFVAVVCFGTAGGQVWGYRYSQDVIGVARKFAQIAGVNRKERPKSPSS